MFSLVMGLWQFLFSKAELHLLIVGLDDAGKTVGTSSLASAAALSCFFVPRRGVSVRTVHADHSLSLYTHNPTDAS